MRIAGLMLALFAVTSLGAAAPDPPPKKPKAPTGRYVSKGLLSRFSFGIGLHMGVSTKAEKQPVLGGVNAHFRMSGLVGVTVEYDFNRVSKQPDPTSLAVSTLHFIPQLRMGLVFYPYRWVFWRKTPLQLGVSPYLLIGVGIDPEADTDRANFQFGLGLELTVWKHHIGITADFRTFIARPTDVEKHKERLQIAGVPARSRPKGTAYYNLKTNLITISLRFYY